MNVAFIPVRGGSKSIPLKNIKPMCGRPLVYWTVRAASLCNSIDYVYVATDSDEIRDAVEGFCSELGGDFKKVRVIGRSAESACDTASTEFAMLEFAASYEFDNIVLIQATSPLLEHGDLDKGFEEFSKEDADSVLSVVPQKRFTWAINEDGSAMSSNYDVYNRPRRQEFDAYYVENGAFYITSKEGLISSKNRVSGRIHIVEMAEDTFLEIDEPSDWEVIEGLLKKRQKQQDPIVKKQIKLFLTDCDGCLTDGGMYYGEDGSEYKKFNTRDGMAFQLLRNAGIKVGIVTGENSQAARKRAEKLQVNYFELDCKDKLATVLNICEVEGLCLSQIAYMGDDLNDLECMKAINRAGGLAICPADAAIDVLVSSNYICKKPGGSGAVREVVGILLHERRNDH